MLRVPTQAQRWAGSKRGSERAHVAVVCRTEVLHADKPLREIQLRLEGRGKGGGEPTVRDCNLGGAARSVRAATPPRDREQSRLRQGPTHRVVAFGTSVNIHDLEAALRKGAVMEAEHVEEIV